MADRNLEVGPDAIVSDLSPSGKLWPKTLLFIRVLAALSCVALASIGSYGFYLGFNTRPGDTRVPKQRFDSVMILISFYMVLFGILGLLAEMKMASAFGKFGFLASRFGRGSLYVFIGSFAVVEGHTFCFDDKGQCLTFSSGVVACTAGALYILSYCLVGTGKAGEYFPAEQREALLGHPGGR